MESETLRKIQVKGHGVAGSFKDRTIVDWLQVHNPTELDFRKVSIKFSQIMIVMSSLCSQTVAGSMLSGTIVSSSSLCYNFCKIINLLSYSFISFLLPCAIPFSFCSCNTHTLYL